MIRYKLETGIGTRIRMSPLGAARCPRLAGKEGTIIGRGCYRSIVRVIFDGSKSPISLHRDYIELTSWHIDQSAESADVCITPSSGH
jgi:hypothetical protein